MSTVYIFVNKIGVIYKNYIVFQNIYTAYTKARVFHSKFSATSALH